jgi:hypothetical protein
MIINYTPYVNTWILIVHNICMQMYEMKFGGEIR